MRRITLFIRLTVKGGLYDGGYVFNIQSRPLTIAVSYMDGNFKEYEYNDIEDIELEMREYPS